MSVANTKGASFADVLKNRNFLALWLGQVISQIGDSFTYLALLITINRLTGSTVAMGLMMISLTLPQLVFSFLAGVVVDRANRKHVMIVSDLLRGLLVLSFLSVRSAEQIYVFYVLGFLLSSVSVFFAPAKTAMIPRIVEGEDKLLTANALSQTIRVVALLVGPALAGFLIAWAGAGVAFFVDSLSYFVSAITIVAINVCGRTLDEERISVRMVGHRLAEGMSYTVSNKTVLGIIVTVLVALLGVGAIEVLFVPYLQGQFGAGPQGLGFVQTAQGVGMLVGSVLVGNLAARFRLTRIIASSLALLGAALAACGLASQFALILLGTFVVGLGLAPLNAALSTMMQVAVPDEKLGRVSSVADTAMTVSYLVSMGGAAFLADAFGIRTVFVGAGIITALAALPALSMMKVPETDVRGAPRPSAVPSADQLVEV
jgi:DHA3 family macrolide efflux protein-like MFS transporter